MGLTNIGTNGKGKPFKKKKKAKKKKKQRSLMRK